ncbi:DUF3800 domain-containing protein [Brevundimonas sp.]|jgi:hypothetical protein|uniref:DUF3800 domain-containing protein n=2 Tax=Brevundimonas TaxID=41275 RepID=UPI00257F1589|nr:MULTISPECIES: DUF3800 domain-containing protein [unclassified Brevundimonas]|tara:strand:+ start:533 stop:1279 length:747 start_codon:yes stop_codon:yes gene_type:complete
MYVDESGDTGLVNSPTRYFALSGLTVHESRWRDLLDHLVAFRRTMKAVHGLPMRTEIHSSEYIRRPPIAGMAKHVRLTILRQFLDELAKCNFISFTHVIVDKQGKPAGYDVFDSAWKVLFQRFENTIGYGNFPGGFRPDRGMVISDNTDGKKLTRLVRRMAVYNVVPGMAGMAARNLPMLRVIEDPHNKDSVDSYFIQACDVTAYFLHQKYAPCSYVRKKGASQHFNRLQPVLNTRASNANGFGIVML